MSRFHPKNAHRKGFTMVELVIVIAVVAILAAISIPAVIIVRDNAVRAELKQNINDSYSKFANAQIAEGKRAASISNYYFVKADSVTVTNGVATGLVGISQVCHWDGESEDIWTDDYISLEDGDRLFPQLYGEFYIIYRRN